MWLCECSKGIMRDTIEKVMAGKHTVKTECSYYGDKVVVIRSGDCTITITDYGKAVAYYKHDNSQDICYQYVFSDIYNALVE